MKIKLFTIPNLLTLSNLLCGMIATVAILTDGDLHLAFWLLVLFAAQLLSPLYDAQLEAMLGLPHDPLRLHYFYAQVYLALAAILMIKNWRKVWQLRLGFKV